MLSNVKYLIPFYYVKSVRYYQGSKITSYVLNEFTPTILLVWFFGEYSIFYFVLYWFVFWLYYEIGYFFNDCYSERKEEEKSHYNELFCSDYLWLSIIRVAVFYLFIFCVSETDGVAVYMTLLMLFFAFHNILIDYKLKIITLLFLGYGRFAFIPWVLGVEEIILALFFLPQVIVKLADYSNIKLNWKVPSRDDLRFRLYLNVSSVVCLYFYSEELAIAFLPFVMFVLLRMGKEKWKR